MKNSMKRFLVCGALSMSAAMLMSAAQASIVLNNTRVVYPESAREADVKMTNNGAQPVVVQSWVDNDQVSKDPSLLKVPFMLMPPLARVDPGQGQTLRLIYTGEAIPKDRESVYYVNVLEIPSKHAAKGDENIVKVAIRTRIKMFYRPATLKGSPEEAAEKLNWSLVQTGSTWALLCSNPSVYNVSMSDVALNTAGKSMHVGDGMVAPGAKLSFALKGQPGMGTQVKYKSIDDYGAPREHVGPLNQ